MRLPVFLVLGWSLIVAGFTPSPGLAADPQKKGALVLRSGVSKNSGKGVSSAPERVPHDSVPASLQIPASVLPAKNFLKQERDPQADEIKLRLEAQLRPLLDAELHFVETVCALTQEQRKPVKQMGERSLAEVTDQFAKLQQAQPNARVVQADDDNPESAFADPGKKIRARLSSNLKSVLEPAQSALYQVEIKKRSEFRNRAQVVLLVARLDGVLILNAQQRNNLTDALSSNWKGAWEQNPQFWQFNEQYFPQIPDQVVLPHLNDKQKLIWRGLQKIGQVFFGRNGGIELGMNVDDVPWQPEIDIRESSSILGPATDDSEPPAQAP